MDNEPCHIKRSDWASVGQYLNGTFEGKDVGTGITVLNYVFEEIDEGPKWHVHTYDEIFLVRTGKALFTIGEKKLKLRQVTSFLARKTYRTSTAI